MIRKHFDLIIARRINAPCRWSHCTALWMLTGAAYPSPRSPCKLHGTSYIHCLDWHLLCEYHILGIGKWKQKKRKTWSWHSFSRLVQVILVEIWTTLVGHNLLSFRQTQEESVKSFNKFAVLWYQGQQGSKLEALKQSYQKCKQQMITLWSLLVVANNWILKRNLQLVDSCVQSSTSLPIAMVIELDQCEVLQLKL